MTPWLGDAETKPAPDPLARIQALVNTVELPDGRDRLVDPAEAASWLVAHDLLADGATVAAPDLAMLRDVREALRALLIGNAGGPPPSEKTWATLRAMADGGTLRAGFGVDGQVAVTTTGGGVRARLVELLVVIRDAQRDGTWQRLKACANDECTWAFYDRSRNRGGTWCDMAECGNKLKNREFRARRRAQR